MPRVYTPKTQIPRRVTEIDFAYVCCWHSAAIPDRAAKCPLMTQSEQCYRLEAVKQQGRTRNSVLIPLWPQFSHDWSATTLSSKSSNGGEVDMTRISGVSLLTAGALLACGFALVATPAGAGGARGGGGGGTTITHGPLSGSSVGGSGGYTGQGGGGRGGFGSGTSPITSGPNAGSLPGGYGGGGSSLGSSGSGGAGVGGGKF